MQSGLKTVLYSNCFALLFFGGQFWYENLVEFLNLFGVSLIKIFQVGASVALGFRRVILPPNSTRLHLVYLALYDYCDITGLFPT